MRDNVPEGAIRPGTGEAEQNVPVLRTDKYSTPPLSDLRENAPRKKFFIGFFLLVRCTATVFAVMLCYRLAATPHTETDSVTVPDTVSETEAAEVFLTQGDRGDAVRQVQSALGTLGYDAGYANGIYSLRTARAVCAFQKDHGLTADGVCTAATKLLLFALADTEPADAVSGIAVYDDLKITRLSAALAVFEKLYADTDLYTLTCAAAVICNRLADAHYPDTLSAVLNGVYAELSVPSDVAAAVSDTAVSAVCRRAAEDALRGQDPTNGALRIVKTVSEDGTQLSFR